MSGQDDWLLESWFHKGSGSRWKTYKEPDTGVTGEYHGKYVGHPVIKGVVSDLPRIRSTALQSASDKLGIPFIDTGLVRYSIRDDQGRGSLSTCFRSAQEGAPVTIEAVIWSEDVARKFGPPVQSTATHAAVHALGLMGMGVEWLNLPRWIRLGLADYAAGSTIRLFKMGLPDLDSVDELIRSWRNYGRHAEDSITAYSMCTAPMAISWLDEEFGERLVKDWVRLVMAGKDTSCLQSLTKLSNDEINKGIEGHLVRHYDMLSHPNHADFRRLFRTAQTGCPAAMGELYSLVNDRNQEQYVMQASHYLGKGHVARGELEESVPLFKKGQGSTLYEHSTIHLGRALVRLGWKGEAYEALYDDLLTDQPCSPYRAEAIELISELESR